MLVGVGLLVGSIFVGVVWPRETSEDLERDISRPLPVLARAIGFLLEMLPCTLFEVTDAGTLLAKGAKGAGLPPDYSPEVVESIEKLCESLKNNDVRFHWIGRW